MLYGGTTGLTSSGNQLWHVEVPGVPGEIDQDLFAQDLFGFAIASGDLDGDGRDDLAISDPWARFSTLYNAGSVVVLYGSIAGIAIDGAQRWTQDSPGIPDVPDDTDLFGTALPSATTGARVRTTSRSARSSRTSRALVTPAWSTSSSAGPTA